ncbi:MAG: hypothetical protein JWO80_4975 [Bryobacterales bacterium]|nr:hypothetical protein [Bryobacterales bacterium]
MPTNLLGTVNVLNLRRDLNISEAKSPVAELIAKHSVLFAQILDRVLSLLIHPSSDRNE